MSYMKKSNGEAPVVALHSRMQKLLEGPIPGPDEIRLLLIDTRVALEHLSLSDRFPTAWMYGNWCCHPEVSRTRLSHEIVSDVQKAYELCKLRERKELARLGLEPGSPEAAQAKVSPELMGEFLRSVQACFRTEELRNELLHFYGGQGIDTSIIAKDANWLQVRFLIIHSLVNRPLAIPE